MLGKETTFASFIICLATIFWGCGDDITRTTISHNDNISVIEEGVAIDSLKCDTTNAGELLFVPDSGEVYLCNSTKWESLKGATGEKGNPGKDGSNGKDGERGAPGDSIVGPEGPEGPRGPQGIQGAAGTAGQSCLIVNDEDGVVTIKCGDGDNADSTKIYKAVCGTTPFDPSKSGCYDNKIYSCNGKPYNPHESLCDTRDGQIYATKLIGKYTWMTENLNFEYSKGTSKSYCYDNDPDNCKKYGRLYTWSAVMDSAATFSNDCKNCGLYEMGDENYVKAKGNLQGVCPNGWHVANDIEYNNLRSTNPWGYHALMYVLKAEYDWNYEETDSHSYNGSNELGFSALPAGTWNTDDGFIGIGEETFFWIVSDINETTTSVLTLTKPNTSAFSEKFNKADAASVRCIMNYEEAAGE